jgi:riboflavin-specific deaminase-like protein
VRSLLPGPADHPRPVEAVFAEYAYPTLAGGRWWLRANMISSLDGAVTGPDGRSGSLSTQADRALFHHLRGLADAVVVGAGTVREENYGPVQAPDDVVAARLERGQQPRPTLVVVTRSLRLEPDARAFSGPDRVIVVTSRAAAWPDVDRIGQVADVIRAGDDEVSLVEMLGHLADRGLRRLLCEGGPALLGDLVADRLVDELCLTVAPVLVGGAARRIATGRAAEPPLGFAAAALSLADDGTLLSRWRRA